MNLSLDKVNKAGSSLPFWFTLKTLIPVKNCSSTRMGSSADLNVICRDGGGGWDGLLPAWDTPDRNLLNMVAPTLLLEILCDLYLISRSIDIDDLFICFIGSEAMALSSRSLQLARR